jgi:hypothetical protein
MTGINMKKTEVHLVLIARASQLTCTDLLKIVGIAKKGCAKVYISPGSWQVLIDVPKSFHKLVKQALWDIGYECVSFLNMINKRPLYLLGRK